MSRLVQIRGPAPRSVDPAPSEPSAGTARVYVETFGCQMNEADAALIVGQLARRGYAIVDDPAAADVILVNTCAIRERAEERVYGRTSQLLRHRRDNPGLVIGITGCMAEHLREGLATRAPHVGLVAGPDSYRRIADLVDRARRGERAVDVALDRHEIYEGLDGHPDDDGVSGFVSVQRGCDEFCSFCVVPYTRGRERAVPPREVLRRVRALAAAGYKEITLLGQTVAAYRWEDVGFPDLLRAVGEVDGIARVRFTSPHPRHFDPRLIAALAELPRCCPYVHLPVQSGSDRVLAAMRRGYGRDQFLRIVEDLRTAIPDLALSTDLLVGFCGETEADHRETLALMEEVRFDSAFMFAYSDRGITHAARRLRDDVDPPTKQRRLQEIIDRQEEHTRAAHAARVGREEEILVGGPARRDDRLVGRTARFQSVLLPLDAGRPGDLVRRRIGASTGHSLVVE